MHHIPQGPLAAMPTGTWVVVAEAIHDDVPYSALQSYLAGALAAAGGNTPPNPSILTTTLHCKAL